MTASGFWAVIDEQLEELTHAQTTTDVVNILSADRDPYFTEDEGERRNLARGNGFFAGSGGDKTVREALHTAGWRTIWSEASYYYAMRAPGGSVITYVEGDIYPHDTKAPQ